MGIIKYEHHGEVVSVDEELKGKHRDHCLCWKCGQFYPGEDQNCLIASRLFSICVEFNLVTPVYECPYFTAKEPNVT